MAVTRSANTMSGATNIADLLERVLDKGVVIAGDIKVSLLDIELLTIQLRLVVCSIDKAQEMGLDWWANSPIFGKPETKQLPPADQDVAALQARVRQLEEAFQDVAPRAAEPASQTPLPPPDQADQTTRFRPITPPPPGDL